MSRESILFSMKKFYCNFYRNDIWNNELAEQFMASKYKKNMRIQIIKSIYECMLNTSGVNLVTKKWVRTAHSIQDIALMSGISFDNAKSQVTYVNKRIAEFAAWDNINIFHYIVLADNIGDEDLQEISYRSKQIIYELSPRGVNRNELLINVSSKQFKTTVDRDDYAVFLKTIKPYIVKQRADAQKEINSLKDACEYFNYIMTPGMTLSAQDLQMRELTLAFFDDEVRSRFSDKNIMEIASTTNKENKSIKRNRVWLEKYNKYLDELSDEESKDFYSVKTTRIQFG